MTLPIAKHFQVKAKSLPDYTLVLKEGGLKGKRIGVYKRAFGAHFKVDELMNKTIDFLKNQGVEVVDIENITSTNVNSLSFQIMLYEYKDGLNKYFSSLGKKCPN